MITRSKRNESYEHCELPDTRRKRAKKEPEEESIKKEFEQPPYEPEPNITIAYYERNPLYEVNIDFDEAHNEWVKNKVKLQNGCYRYKNERKVNTRKKR